MTAKELEKIVEAAVAKALARHTQQQNEQVREIRKRVDQVLAHDGTRSATPAAPEQSAVDRAWLGLSHAEVVKGATAIATTTTSARERLDLAALVIKDQRARGPFVLLNQRGNGRTKALTS